jgi:hypothetical protein
MCTMHRDLLAKFLAMFNPKTVAVWEKMVMTWERDPTQPNPYEKPVNGEFSKS